MSVLEIVLLAVVGELGLGVAIGRFLRGPRPPAAPIPVINRSTLLNIDKPHLLIKS